MGFDQPQPLGIYGKYRILCAGSFQGGIANVTATDTFAIASGTDITLTADVVGTAGNALDWQANDDGRTIDMAAATGDSNFDSVVRFDEDGWVMNLVGGSGGGEGINLLEDTTNKILTIMFETTVSDFDDFETAIGTTTHASILTGTTHGATTLVTATHNLNQEAASAVTSVEEGGSPSKTTFHFTDGVTTVTAMVSAINTGSGYTAGTKTMTASGSGTHFIANADAVAKQDMSGGVDAVAISNIRGRGFTPSQTGIGAYTITFDDSYPTFICVGATLQFATADDKIVLAGVYDSAAKTVKLQVWDVGDAAAKDVDETADRINFIVFNANSGLG